MSLDGGWSSDAELVDSFLARFQKVPHPVGASVYCCEPSCERWLKVAGRGQPKIGFDARIFTASERVQDLVAIERVAVQFGK